MQITDSNFKDIINNNNAVIYLGAEWCPGCKVLKPTIEKLEKEINDKIIGITDVDTNAEITVEYEIRQIPTVLFFKDGKLIDKMSGNSTNEKLILSKIEMIYDK